LELLKVKLLILFFIILIGLIACNKDDKDDIVSAPINPSLIGFSAKINGVSFNPNETSCMLIVDSFIGLRYFGLLGMYQSEILSVGFMDNILTEVVDSNTTSGQVGIMIGYEDTLSSNSYSMVASSLDFTKFRYNQ
jgi:hypothetical protein